ncbi:MAG: RnfABCDGE type electron transport complex subunit C, partial [Firmicutes bacterium]|nr:RnfABCDGE type electron transport complex subunit C [Bacillota bacterium]
MQRIGSFFGGIYPPGFKDRTSAGPLENLPAPETVVVPLWQYGDQEATPVVAKGDHVLKGQVLGKGSSRLITPVHSPVSGEVTAVEPRIHACGDKMLSVVIENDGLENWVEKESHPDPIGLDPGAIRDKIYAGGVVGMGGAGFSTAIKLDPPEGAVIDYLIINGCECEPYLTNDYRLMMEFGDDLILGAKLMAKACRARRIIIAVENNKPDALEIMQEKAAPIEVVALPTKYPQGGERQLIQALTGREVPSGGLPYQA